MTSSPDVIVIGAGVLGLCSAAELGQRGHAVTVIDPGGPNASSVAAGMLAPALECLSDASTPERAALLKRARDLWPDFAEVFGLPLHRDGVDWRGPDIPAAIARLAAMGFTARPTPAGLTSPVNGVVMTYRTSTGGSSTTWMYRGLSGSEIRLAST